MKNVKSKIITDLCGNSYLIKEDTDIQGRYLEVSEILEIDGQKMTTYLCDLGLPFESSDNDILDEIDEMRSRIVDD